jgi:hypothetical protein
MAGSASSRYYFLEHSCSDGPSWDGEICYACIRRDNDGIPEE